MTIAYLMDTVVQAGYEAIELVVEDIVLDDGDGRFYDQQGRHLDVVFKLYPWEWLLEDEFGPAVLADSDRPGGTTWVEPVYKMLWSTKALLPVLWQLFGADPELRELLLPAYFADEMPSTWRTYVRKPLWGREGAERDGRSGTARSRSRCPAATAPKAGSCRSSRRCRTSLASTGRTIPCSGPGWSTANRPGWGSARATG